MTITDIKFTELRCALAEPVKTSFGTRSERRHLLVEVLTDKGLTGVGETWTNFPAWAVDERKVTLQGIKQVFIGLDPLNINAVWAQIDSKILKADVIQYGSKGPIYQALSGIDIALWDIMGKAYGVPVYQLLGGAVSSSVEAYASGISAGDYQRRVPKCLAEGFRGFKIKIGFGEDSDARTLKAVRAEVGQLNLYADANQKWKNAKEAAAQMRALGEFGVGFFEEPVSAAFPDEYKALSDAGIAPVAAGENLYSRHEFHTYFSRGLVDIIQPDVTKCGGITETWAACEQARLYDVKTALHMFSTAVGLAASLNIMLASPQAHSMEYDVLDNIMMTELPAKTFYRLERGSFIIAEQMPGIGIELDKEFLEKYGV
ncbi:MAG: mandelate racemase/muconate lactonizing enzyme family protein [Oscillospiraceae bacterium]|nr:mandelate racemase/muconate lactonizing enzyme family protein [Oscillospiraceae bacterium]